MKATFLYGPRDVRIEEIARPTIEQPTDTVAKVTLACICGSDLWDYNESEKVEVGRPRGHEFLGIIEAVGTASSMAMALGVVRNYGTIGRVGAAQYETIPFGFGPLVNNITISGGIAPARAYIEELMPDILSAKINPGKVFDLTVGLDEVPAGYEAMSKRTALKVLVKP
jgi:threonine dehydrogenase-like Zn-dependent dehydrogenase